MVSDSFFCHTRLLNLNLKVPNQSLKHFYEKICFTASQALPKEQILQYTEIGNCNCSYLLYQENREGITLCLQSPFPLPAMDQTVSYLAWKKTPQK